MRECKSCKVIKPLSSYHKDKGTKGGHKYTCKKCTNAKYEKKIKLFNQDIVAFNFYE